MDENKPTSAARVCLAAILIGTGVVFVAAAIWFLPKPTLTSWLIGWGLIAVGGYLVPHRLTAVIIIGAALTMETPALPDAYRRWMKIKRLKENGISCPKPQSDQESATHR